MRFGVVTTPKAKNSSDTSKYLFINMSFIKRSTMQ